MWTGENHSPLLSHAKRWRNLWKQVLQEEGGVLHHLDVTISVMKEDPRVGEEDPREEIEGVERRHLKIQGIIETDQGLGALVETDQGHAALEEMMIDLAQREIGGRDLQRDLPHTNRPTVILRSMIMVKKQNL